VFDAAAKKNVSRPALEYDGTRYLIAGLYGGIINEGKKMSDESALPVFQQFNNLR
jgi:hypothetical protein